MAAHEAVLELVTVWESPSNFEEEPFYQVAESAWPGASESKRSWSG